MEGKKQQQQKQQPCGGNSWGLPELQSDRPVVRACSCLYIYTLLIAMEWLFFSSSRFKFHFFSFFIILYFELRHVYHSYIFLILFHRSVKFLSFEIIYITYFLNFLKFVEHKQHNIKPT